VRCITAVLLGGKSGKRRANLMPELPEVETTLRGLEPVMSQQTLAGAVVRERRLRWPIPRNLNGLIRGQRVVNLSRRGKYLLVELERGHLLWHLGMSGSFSVVAQSLAPETHDHVDFLIMDGPAVRFNDPRRFGSIHYLRDDPNQHPLLAKLGPEPLADKFDGDYLWTVARNRKVAIKAFLMNSHIVVGVGNIYANEALFLAGIHPTRAAGRISLARMGRLADCVKDVLRQAIAQGGTTLRDFTSGDGQPGYFQQSLQVYGRAQQPCVVCRQPVRLRQLGQRATYYCSVCQH
jgi:formamidopyrimidine-DNA glycosylase